MKKIGLALASLVAVFASVRSHAAGFEKSVFWSGSQAGYAGAGLSSVSGSQSVYFNPAGLASSGKGDVSLNFSPTQVKLKGSLASTNRVEETDHNFSPIGAFTASYRWSEKFGIGVGAYVAAGSKAIYDSVDLSGAAAAVTAFKPRIATDFAVMEYALGGGYELSPGFRVGIAWRILKASGALSTLKGSTAQPLYSYINLGDLKDTKYNGFRIGMQYTNPEDKWGAGLGFRNETKFNAAGTGTGLVVSTASGNSVGTTTVGAVAVGTSLPMEISLGGHYRFSDDFRFLSGVDFLKYSKNAQLAITGTLTNSVTGAVALPNIPLNWEDMWNFRLGGEYTGLKAVKLRAGYALTTRVTSKVDARATITPPSVGHLLTAGAGTSVMGDKLDLDGAFEYAFNSGNGSMSATPAGASTRELLASTNSDMEAKVMALHLGATYRF